MEIEKVWTEWRQEKKIGKGSYGTVYKCCREKDGKKEYSAVKVISIPQDDVELIDLKAEGMTAEQTKEYYKEVVNDFMQEINILESMKGEKNVVDILEYKVIEKKDGIGWQIFIRMELLTDFKTYSGDKNLGEKELVKLGIDICNALSACEKHKIIHRDIKPENIFVDDEGNFKLGDFGVARQLEKTNASMSMKGTYNYMAPEVYKSKKYDSRADIYSLGLVIYRLLNNNRMPFTDTSKQLIRYSERQAAFDKRMDGDRIPPIENISANLNEVILKACAFKPEDRFKTIEDFKNALELILSGDNHNSFKTVVREKKNGLFVIVSVALLIAAVFSVKAMLNSKLNKDDGLSLVKISESEFPNSVKKANKTETELSDITAASKITEKNSKTKETTSENSLKENIGNKSEKNTTVKSVTLKTDTTAESLVRIESGLLVPNEDDYRKLDGFMDSIFKSTLCTKSNTHINMDEAEYEDVLPVVIDTYNHFYVNYKNDQKFFKYSDRNDPLKKLEGSDNGEYFEFPVDSVNYIIKNIFNVTPKVKRTFEDSLCSDWINLGIGYNPYYYNGNYYVGVKSRTQSSETVFCKQVGDRLYDGTYNVFVYSVTRADSDGNPKPIGTAKVGLKLIDNKRVWSLFGLTRGMYY